MMRLSLLATDRSLSEEKSGIEDRVADDNLHQINRFTLNRRNKPCSHMTTKASGLRGGMPLRWKIVMR
jgi:hypothetical protein